MKLVSTFTLILMLCFLISGVANAYPIFYKCDAKRQMSDVLTGDELSKKLLPLLSLSVAEQTTLIKSYCDGFKECEAQLQQMLKMAQINQNIAEKIFTEELNALYAQAPLQPIHEVDSKSFELRKKIQEGAFEVAACRNTISKLPAESFLSKDAARVLMYYPHYSEYTYVTGCRNRDGKWIQKNGNGVFGIQKAIKKSLAMGVDPYTYLAIGLMEGGSGGWNDLYLDPIGKMKVMGCTESHGDVSRRGKDMLESFGNRHKIEPGIVQNDRLSGELQTALATEKKALPGASYYCRNLTTTVPKMVLNADPTECCLKLGFTPVWDDRARQLIEEAFTVKFVAQTQSRQMPGKTDPAFRIQGFNGFSKLMGGAEGVSTFRAGVNYYETPAYGFQGMDYILNSLVSNPWLKQEIQKQSKELGVNAPSILCMDVAIPGTYQVDSDYYFIKHRDAPRLKALQGRSWASLSGREKKVIAQELGEESIRKELIEKFGGLPKEIPQKSQGLFVNSIKAPDGTVYKAVANSVTHTTSYEKDGPNPDQKVVYSDYSEFFKAQDSVLDAEKAKKGFTIISYLGKVEIKFVGGMDPSFILSLAMLNSCYTCNPLFPPPPYTTTNTDGTKCTLEKNYSQTTCKDHDGKSVEWSPTQTIAKYEWPDGKGFTISTTAVAGKKSNQLTYADGTTVTQSNETIELSENKLPTHVKIEDFLSYYFKKIYPNRSTVSKASPLPWTDLPNDALQEIISRVNGDQSM